MKSSFKCQRSRKILNPRILLPLQFISEIGTSFCILCPQLHQRWFKHIHCQTAEVPECPRCCSSSPLQWLNIEENKSTEKHTWCDLYEDTWFLRNRRKECLRFQNSCASVNGFGHFTLLNTNFVHHKIAALQSKDTTEKDWVFLSSFHHLCFFFFYKVLSLNNFGTCQSQS